MAFSAAILLAALTVTYQPAQPTVGDLITIEFPAAVTLEPSPDFEVVRREGSRVVVRTFRPAPFVLHGVAGNVAFRNLVVPVRSVLDPSKPMTPAPSAPPREVPYSPEPFYAIAVAAVLALLVWLLVWHRSRLQHPHLAVRQSPEERYRTAIVSLRAAPARNRWAALADETRAYLAATRPRLGAELTTRELLPRLADDEQVVAAILHQGDLEKFSTRGADPVPFDDVAEKALALAAPAEPAEEAFR